MSARAAFAEGPEAPERIEYAEPRQIGVIADPAINESSGMARSIENEGAFWTHNDSGDRPRVFLIDRDGNTLATVGIEGARAYDWEDMASFKRGGESFLLIGDVGDNSARRREYTLYLIPEPKIAAGTQPAALSVKPSLVIRFKYEDGSHNCESVGVDATTGKIYLVSKRDKRVRCKVYELPIPENQPTEPLIARQIAEIKSPATTAMDISPDGLRAVVLTYGHAREYSRGPDESWSSAFSQEERLVVMPRREQGEAICYGADGRTLYLTSEGVSQPLWEVSPTSSK